MTPKYKVGDLLIFHSYFADGHNDYYIITDLDDTKIPQIIYFLNNKRKVTMSLENFRTWHIHYAKNIIHVQ